MKRAEFEKLLFKTFPYIYQRHSLSPQETCMCWGIDCGPGWYNLIWELSEEISSVDSGRTVQASQVKEKYGLLSWYFDGGDKGIEKLVRKYEDLSKKTCESCGKVEEPNTLKGRGWVYNMCNGCWKKFKKRRNG